MEGLQQLVDAEKVSPDAAARLSQLRPGAICTHRSWGFGKVRSWDLVLEQLVVDFENKAGHAMQFQYAADSLTPLSPDHILARKRTDIEAVRREAAESPETLMRCVVSSLERSATASHIEATLCPDVIDRASWKKWWEAARRAMKKDGHFVIPAAKTAAISLLDAPAEEVGRDPGEFASVKGAKAQAAWIVAAMKRREAVASSVEAFRAVIERAEDTLRKTRQSINGDGVQLALVRDELAEAIGISPSEDVATARMLGGIRNLGEVVDSLSSLGQARALAVLHASEPKRFEERVAGLLGIASQRLAASVHDYFRQRVSPEAVVELIRRGLREHTLSTDALVWLLRNRKDPTLGGLIEPRMFSTLLAAIERVQSGGGRSMRLHDAIVGDKTLLSDMLEGADALVVRDITRAILLTPVFTDMDRRSLLGRLVKEFPDLATLVGEGMDRARGTATAPQEAAKPAERLIVSWASLEKRKLELEDLVQKQIPANTKDIAVARSYGDLSENAEFKFAKEHQRVLQRRRAEIEQELLLSTGTDFKGADTSRAGIGTIVTLNDGGKRERYTILGAWDTDPAHHVISYLTPMARAVNHRQAGERATVPGDKPGVTREVVIESIEAYNP